MILFCGIPLTARPSFWRHLLEAYEIQTVNCKWRTDNTQAVPYYLEVIIFVVSNRAKKNIYGRKEAGETVHAT